MDTNDVVAKENSIEENTEKKDTTKSEVANPKGMTVLQGESMPKEKAKVAKNKKPPHTATEKLLMSTFVSQIVICMVIVLGLIFSIFNAHNEGSATPEESTTLSLIGMAISVWIGLNIYNTISKEDFHNLKAELRALKEGLLPLKEDLLTLKEKLLPLKGEFQTTRDNLQGTADGLKLQLNKTQAETEKAVERLYTEMLKSKFRITSDNTASMYFAQSSCVDSLPIEICEKILKLEDLFQISYRLYGEHISSKDSREGVELAKELKEAASELRDKNIADDDQYGFLMGYASWRQGDFLYYQARYSGSFGSEEKKYLATCAIDQYKNVMKYLFAAQDIKGFYDHSYSNPKHEDALCYLANDIAAAYIDIIGELSDEQLNEAITMEKFAVKHSKGIPNKVREKFLRNLGCAYERKDDASEALKQYKEAYRIYSGNCLCAHCIGSLYRKQALKHFFPDLTLLELAEKKLYDISTKDIGQLNSPEREELEQQLKRAVYWYNVKQTNNYGIAEPRLVELNDCLYRLTKDSIYQKKAEEAKEHKTFSDQIV